MINSSKRKLSLSGWLKENDNVSYNTSLKLQKFLFFYEVLTKIAGEQAEFNYLTGYKNDLIFSNVWYDYTKENDQFKLQSQKAYQTNKESINEERAKICSFIVGTMTEKELSDFTHLMNIWKSKEDRLMSGEKQVRLEESDFNSYDKELMQKLSDMYPMQLIENSKIINMDKKYFVFSKENAEKLTEEHSDTLLILSKNSDIYNPVFVELDEEGRLVVD